MTRNDARKAFFGIENVPTTAITMGIKTIRKSKRIVLMAWGNNKSSVVQKAIEGEVNSNISASYLQNHKNALKLLEKLEDATIEATEQSKICDQMNCENNSLHSPHDCGKVTRSY